MKRYIALLRGINVGGNNKISMPELKELFEQSGFQQVSTYINSGNVIFSSESTDEVLLKEECERLILHRFHLSILVAVITAEDLISALQHAPSWWGEDKDSKHNAIFVIPPALAEDIILEVGEAKPEYEKVDCFGRVIFWSAPVDTFSRTRWSKVVGSSVYNNITIRNANTTKKLFELVQ